jgi:integral membrane protein (TIGR01906 family)
MSGQEVSLNEEARTPQILRLGLQLLIPVLLLLSSVWVILLTARIWIPVEYRMPGFPPDRYGFTLQDRIEWSAVDIRFLLGSEPISYFDRFQLADGSPMHNERELVHMEDVKTLLDATRWVLGAGILIAAALTFILVRMRGGGEARQAWRSGARWTIYLMLLLGVGLVLGFSFVFVGFHRLFFEGSSWIFPLSDTFIRLYPERFWRDTFALVVIVTGLLTGLVYLVARRAVSKQKPA